MKWWPVRQHSGQYYEQLMTTAHAICRWPAAALSGALSHYSDLRRCSEAHCSVNYNIFWLIGSDGCNFWLLLFKFPNMRLVSYHYFRYYLTVCVWLWCIQPEPFFLTFALYNAKEGKKISEDFHVDANSDVIRRMLPSDGVHTTDGASHSRPTANGTPAASPTTVACDMKWLELQKQVMWLHLIHWTVVPVAWQWCPAAGKVTLACSAKFHRCKWCILHAEGSSKGDDHPAWDDGTLYFYRVVQKLGSRVNKVIKSNTKLPWNECFHRCFWRVGLH